MVLVLLGALGTTGVAAPVAATAPPQPVPPEARAPAPGESFDVEAATRAYLDRLTPEERERSDAYMEGGYWLILWNALWAVGVAWLLLATGLSARMRDLARRLVPWRWLQPALYGVQYLLAVTLLTLPLTFYEGFFREHRYGLANQGLGPWLGERGMGLLVGLVMTSLLLVALYAVFRRAARTWWLWGAGVIFVFFVFGMLVAPVYVDPLFNTYRPLEDEELKGSILSLARANGVPAEDVYQFDASRQTDRISANVAGFAGTLRIRLNDNLLNRGTPEEVEAVMAHEIGHYVLHHIPKGLIFLGVVTFVGFAFLRWGFHRLVGRFGERWKVEGIADPAGLPVLALLVTVYGFLLTPVMNNYVRAIEAEADAFAVNASRHPDGFASMAVKLAEYRKLEPAEWEEWLLYDHPSGRSRIHRAMQWKAENLELFREGAAPSTATGATAAGTLDEITVETPDETADEIADEIADEPPGGNP